MQAFEIFTAGKHTAANGPTLSFTEDMLKAAAEAYDPALHEAPIVVGHPKDNHPAFGWVKSLSYDEGKVIAEPDQVDPDFSELVSAGRYKKRSASFYLPDSPSNPKPGTLYLRHVGFLGAMPPSVKGLKDVAFNENEEGIVEFSDTSPYIWSMLASAIRGFREWIIAEKGVETADKVVSSYVIDELNSEADRQRQARDSSVAPAFNEPTHEDSTMTPEQIKAMQDENAALKAQASQTADFAEKQADLAKREAALARKEIEGQVDALVKDGKVLPAQKAGLVEFMASLDDGETVVEFGEGDQAKKISPRQFMRDYLASMPNLVDFSEKSKDAGGADEFDVKAAERKIFDQVTSGNAGA